MEAPLTRTVGRATVTVHPDAAALATAAADEAAAVLREAVDERAYTHAMFATGNSQLGLVEALTAEDGLPWDRVVVFHMDEYLGLSDEHPASFKRWIRERITERVHPAAAYYVEGEASAVGECDRYGELLREHPLDLCCLGVGENGHLAFNDPPVADFDDPMRVKLVRLDEASRRQQVGEGHFPDLDSVPTHALTVTIPALLAARRVIAVVPEQRKARAVREALLGPVTTACPASVLRHHDNVTIHLDPESASELGWL